VKHYPIMSLGTARGAPSPPVQEAAALDGSCVRQEPIASRRSHSARAQASVEKVLPTPMRLARVVVVDADANTLRIVSTLLGNAQYEVKALASLADALDVCTSFRPDLVIAAAELAAGDTVSLLREIKTRWPGLCVIIQSDFSDIPAAVLAAQNGAFAYLVKPVAKDELLGQVSEALKVSTFASTQGGWRAGIVSRSRLMEERIGQANLAAKTSFSVLLTGELGTEKELFARAIHAASAYRLEPFWVHHCAQLAPGVVHGPNFDVGPLRLDQAATFLSEFDFRAAGTLLLEEINVLSLDQQGQLLVALRTAGTCPGAKLICTTSKELPALVKAGEFRADLFDLIAVLVIDVPPLGRRREDIPLLINHFLAQVDGPAGVSKSYAPKAIELLAARNWPGNVAQLHSVVKSNVALSPTKLMTAEFVQQSLVAETQCAMLGYDEARDEFSKGYLLENMQLTDGNVTRSARLAKRNRTDFYKLLRRYEIEPTQFKAAASGR
jgi:two-component system, NtrC family, response regulator GlrR